MELLYTITRGVQAGRQLTPSQKTSSLFAEEPVVLGRVLRRGAGPIRISPEDFERNKTHLLRLEKAGSIVITPPQGSDVSEPEKSPEAPPAEPPKDPEKTPEPETQPPPPETTPSPEKEEKAPEESPEAPAEEPSTTPPSTEETEPAAVVAEEQPRKKRRKE